MRTHFLQSFRLYQDAQRKYQLYLKAIANYRGIIMQTVPHYQKADALCKLERCRKEYCAASEELHVYNKMVQALLKLNQQTDSLAYTLTAPPAQPPKNTLKQADR